MTMTSDQAAALAAIGWPIFPLRPNSKLPAISAWQHVATSNVDAVAAWWKKEPNAGIGIATGHNGVFVLDVDSANGKRGAASLAALEAIHGALPVTLKAETASGGKHLYFSSALPIRNSASRIAADLDIRGAGGYVVAPPTMINGHAYRWIDTSLVAVAPAWLVQLATAAAPTMNAATGVATVEPTPELLADLRSALAEIPADNRDEWIAIGAALRALGESGRELWVEWSCKSPKHNSHTDPHAWETIGHDSTGPAAVFAKAQRVGWQNPEALRRAAELFGQQATAEGALRPVRVDDVLTAHVAPPRFVVDRLLPVGHVTLLGAHGGSGKSVLALAIAAHVACGRSWAGLAVEHRPALYVSLEDPSDVVRIRLRRIIEAYGLDLGAVAENLRVLDGTGGDAALMTESAAFGVRSLIETAKFAELRLLVGDAGLIVADNASDAYDGAENDRRQVRSFIRSLTALGRASDAAVLLLAHVDKSAAKFGALGNSYSGSTAWHNSARSRLALATSRGGGVELIQEKSNLGPIVAPVRLCWAPAGVLVPDLSPRADDGAASDADALLVALGAATRDGVDVPTARTGPATAQHVLEQLPDLPSRLRGAQGREAFWIAITELQRSGKIGTENYQNYQRKLKQRFSIISAPVAPVAPVPEIGAISEPERATAPVAPVPGARGVGIYGAHELEHGEAIR